MTLWNEGIRSQTVDDPLLRKVRDDESLDAAEEEELACDASTGLSTISTRTICAVRTATPAAISSTSFARRSGSCASRAEKRNLRRASGPGSSSRSLTPQQAEYLCLLKNRGIATGHVRLDDLFEPPLSILDAAGKGIELFGEQGLKQAVEQLNEDVFETAS